MQVVSTASSDLRVAIDAADRRFMEAFNAGDIDRAVDVTYTTGAIILPPGAEPVSGKDGIAAFWRAAVEQLGITRVELSTVSLEEAGESAHQVGQAKLAVAGGTQEVYGKYVVIWKQEQGEWRWHIDIWNLNA